MPKETFHNLPEEKQQKLIDIAAETFASNAYKAASISKIVRKTGIAKGSFYQYFEDKKDLYRYLIELGTEKKIKLAGELPALAPSIDLFGYMRWQFLTAVFYEIRYPHLARITYRAFVEEIPFPEMAEEMMRRGTTQLFKQLISQGILHGEVGVWVDPDVAAFLMEVIFYQFGKYFIERLNLDQAAEINQETLEKEEAQQLLSNLMDILEAGMKRNPQQRKDYFDKA